MAETRVTTFSSLAAPVPALQQDRTYHTNDVLSRSPATCNGTMQAVMRVEVGQLGGTPSFFNAASAARFRWPTAPLSSSMLAALPDTVTENRSPTITPYSP